MTPDHAIRGDGNVLHSAAISALEKDIGIIVDDPSAIQFHSVYLKWDKYEWGVGGLLDLRTTQLPHGQGRNWHEVCPHKDPGTTDTPSVLFAPRDQTLARAAAHAFGGSPIWLWPID